MTFTLEAWHLISGLVVTAGWIWVQFLRPMQAKQQDLDKRLALAEQRLESGDRKFQEVLDAIERLRVDLKADHACLERRFDTLEERLRKVEAGFQASVFAGVGEKV